MLAYLVMPAISNIFLKLLLSPLITAVWLFPLIRESKPVKTDIPPRFMEQFSSSWKTIFCDPLLRIFS
jgi:hypothetical protein